MVEDNDDVRIYSTSILTELGYVVLEAVDAQAALDILQTDTAIDLLFTDVVLPGVSGRVLADEARRVRPGLRVLFTTGYSRNAIVHHGRLDAGVELITKPFTFEQLAGRVRDGRGRVRRRSRATLTGPSGSVNRVGVPDSRARCCSHHPTPPGWPVAGSALRPRGNR